MRLHAKKEHNVIDVIQNGATLISGLRHFRVLWRKRTKLSHNLIGSYAKPAICNDVQDLCNWELGILVPAHGLLYRVHVHWQNLISMPTCRFTPGIFHPHIFTDGMLCVSSSIWRPAHGNGTLNGGLIGYLVELLAMIIASPGSFPTTSANPRAHWLLVHDLHTYESTVREINSKLETVA